MSTTTVQAFAFDKNYKNLEQVAPYWDAYLTRYQEIKAEGWATPYNDLFRGRIEGLVAIDQKNEDTAIYLLQVTRHLREWEAKVENLRSQGYVEPTDPKDLRDRARRFPAVAIVDKRYGLYGEVCVVETARLMTDGTTVLGVLPKGARSNGFSISNSRDAYVLVKR